MKVLILTIFFSISIYSQGEYLEKDEFGISGGYSISGNDMSSVSGIDAVLSILGIVDFGVQHASGEHDTEFSSTNLESSGTIFSLAYIFKKSDNNFNLKFILGYYTGSVSENSGQASTSEGVVAGFGIYPRIVKSKNFEMRFILEFTYGFISTSTITSYYRDEYSTYDDTRNLAAGISFNIGLSENFNLIFSPFGSKDLLASSNSVVFGVNGRILLSFKGASWDTFNIWVKAKFLNAERFIYKVNNWKEEY